jgi:hypothetical protein
MTLVTSIAEWTMAAAATAGLLTSIAFAVRLVAVGGVDGWLEVRRDSLRTAAVLAGVVVVLIAGAVPRALDDMGGPGEIVMALLFLAAPAAVAAVGCLVLGVSLRDAPVAIAGQARKAMPRGWQVLTAVCIVIAVYAPGVWFGTLGAGPYTNDLYDWASLCSVVGIYGGAYGLAGFTTGFGLGAVALLLLRRLGGARGPSRPRMLVAGTVTATLAASLAFFLTVGMYGSG